MNVIVSNLNRNMFLNLNVDIVKSVDGEFSADEIIQTFSNFFFNRMFLDITSIRNYRDISNIQKLSIGLDVSKIILLLNDDPVVNDAYISKLVGLGIYNFARNESDLIRLYNNPNQYKDVSMYKKNNNSVISDISMVVNDKNKSTRIIGFKNFSEHAGATSLIYMIKCQLEKNYSVISIEINKSDFLFFNDKSMISVPYGELNNTLNKFMDVNVILLDLNDLSDSICESVCSDIIYLIEPSILAINKIIKFDAKSFIKLRNYKVVLNKCLLSNKDISIFAKESGTKIFYVLPPMNDREDNSKILFPFLERLGLYRKVSSNQGDNFKNKFFKF